MPSGGAAGNSSPRAGATAHRRREKPTSEPSPGNLASTYEDEVSGNFIARHFGHPRFAGGSVPVPEKVMLLVEDVMLGFGKLGSTLKSRKNMGRRILGFLIIMVVLSMFMKFSYLVGNHYNLEMINGKHRRLNGLFILNTWSKPQHQSLLMLAAERDEEELNSMPKRVLEKYPVSILLILDYSLQLFRFLSCFLFLIK